MNRSAFTMIELVFVIVILGILASVAIGKLSATRDDANNARDCQNIAGCVTDLLAEHTAKGTAMKSKIPGCINAEASTQNSIAITVTAVDVTVSGAPNVCPHLNATSVFGGSSISF